MKYYCTVLFGITFYLQVFSCSCTGPERFVDGIGRNSIIFLGELISEDTLHLPSGNNSISYRISTLKILKIYNGAGKLKSDTIKLRNSTGFECFQSLARNSIGKRFILRGNLEEVLSYDFTTWKEKSYGSYFHLFLCDEPVIYIEEQKAKGYITRKRGEAWDKLQKLRDKHQRIKDSKRTERYAERKRYDYSKYRRIKANASERAERYREKHIRNFDYYQNMSLKKVERIIRSHLKKAR